MMRFLLVCTLIAMLPACQGAGRAGKKPVPETRVRLGDMPESYAALWKAWLLQDPSYRSLRAAALEQPQQANFLVENLIGTLLGELSAGRVSPGSKDEPSTLQRARLELVYLGPVSASGLAEVLVLGTGLGPVAVQDLLIDIGGPAVQPLLLQLGREDTPIARRRASRALGEIAFERIPADMTTGAVRAALAQHLEQDGDWIVRSQCALALASWGRSTSPDMAETSRQIVRALVDEDAGVRKDVIQALGRLGDPRAIPALVNHLERCINGGRMGEIVLVQKSLKVLARDRRTRTPGQWRLWWRDNRPRILARIRSENG